MCKQKMFRAVLGLVAISAVATPAFAQPTDAEAGVDSAPNGAAAEDPLSTTTDVEPVAESVVAAPAPVGSEEIVEELTEDDGGFAPDPVLDEYIAVSSKVTQRPSQTPASVAVISRDQIDLMGYNSVGEALRDVPGLFVSYDLQNYNVAVRGLLGGARSGSRLLKIMIDGRVAGFVSGGVYFLGPEFVPMQAVERIEVMRGAASSLYGAGAYVGAINVVTRRPTYDGKTAAQSRVSMRGAVAGQRGGGGEVTQTVVGEDGYFMLAASYDRLWRSGLKVPTASPFADTLTRSNIRDLAAPVSLFARGEYFLPRGTLSVVAIAQLHDYASEFADLKPLTGISRSDIWTVASTAAVEVPLQDGWSVLGSAGIATGAPGGSDRLAFGVGADAGKYATRDFSYVESTAQLEVRRSILKKGWLLAGLDGYYHMEQPASYSDYDPTTMKFTARTPSADQTLNNVAAYTQALVPLNKKLTLAGGLRYDQHNVFGGDVSARAGVVAAINEQVSGKLLLGRSYRAPSAEQLYGRSVGEGDLLGASDLQLKLTPQYLNGIEAIGDVFVTRNVHFNAAAYINQYQDAISYVSEAGRLNPRSFNAIAYGGEATLRAAGTFSGAILDATSSVTLQRLAVERKVVGGVARQLIPDNEGVPQAMVQTRLGVRLAKQGIGAFVRHRWTGRRTPSQSNLVADRTASMTTPSYFLAAYHHVDLGLNLKPMAVNPELKVGLSAQVSNVFDAKYSEVGFSGVDIPGMPRVFWAKLNAEF